MGCFPERFYVRVLFKTRLIFPRINGPIKWGIIEHSKEFFFPYA